MRDRVLVMEKKKNKKKKKEQSCNGSSRLGLEKGVENVSGTSSSDDIKGCENGENLTKDVRLPVWVMWMIGVVLGLCYIGLSWPSLTPFGGTNFTTPSPRPPTHTGGLMNVFQVYRPPPTPPPNKIPCTLFLMSHIFAFSYNAPFVGSYQPPNTTTCPFNTVTITLTVLSSGRQFDRLALMYLGDIEVFRTSTAEPTSTGIEWTYRKDMTPYLSLWKQPQKLIFDLGNLVDETYTGTFNTTLTATFWDVAESEPPRVADVVLPISKGRSGVGEGQGSAFTLPGDDAVVDLALPRGTDRAIVSISACGQATEEFWYSNVLSEDTETFANTTTGSLYGGSSFREVQLLIDGYLAGVVWPFPIIFTGGIAPGFWRPVVGIDAFDLREPEIDVTAWVPWLSDGKEHRFQIRVVGLEGEGGNVSLSSDIGDYWVVTGKILVFLSDKQAVTISAGSSVLPSIFAPDPAISTTSSTTQSVNGTNETLSSSVTASRSVVVTSEAGSWIQNLEFSSENLLTSEGLTQSTTQFTKANIATINYRDPRLSFSVASSYPLSVNTTIGIFEDGGGIFIDASLSRGLTIDSTGRSDGSLFTLTSGESKLDTFQFGTAHYSSQPNRSYSFGDTTQEFLESSRQGITIVHVEAVNGSVAFTDSNIGGATILSAATQPYRSLRGMVGRGPGRPISRPP